MQKILFILFFIICSAGAEPADASQAISQWYFGQWSCLIDGRPSTMVWEVVNDPQQTCNGDTCTQTSGVRVLGWFRERNATWVRLYLSGSSNTQLRMMYNNTDPWVLNLRQPGYATGHTTWQGRRYPLECRKT